MDSTTIVTINYFTSSHNIKITHSYEIFAQSKPQRISRLFKPGAFK